MKILTPFLLVVRFQDFGHSNEMYTPRNSPDFDLSEVKIQPGNWMEIYTKQVVKGM